MLLCLYYSQHLSCRKDALVILGDLITVGVLTGECHDKLLVAHSLCVHLDDLMDKILGLLAQGELGHHLRVTDHHVTVPMAAAHVAAISPAACISQLTHLLDCYKRKGITVEGDGMVAAFLRELIRQFLWLGKIAGGLVKRCLDLLVKLFQLMPQGFQVILLGPRLARYAPILGNILVQRLVTLLVLLDIAGYLFQCLNAVAHGTKAVVLAHGKLAVIMLVLVVTLQPELVACIDFLLHPVVPHVHGVHHQREAVHLAQLPVFVADGTPSILQGCTHVLNIVGSVCRELLYLRHCQAGQYPSVLTILGYLLELLIVLGHVPDDGLVLLYLILGCLHTPLGLAAGLHIGLAL